MTSFKIKRLIFPLLLAIFMRTLCQWIEDWIEHILCLKRLPVCKNDGIHIWNDQFSAAIGNVNAQLVLTNRGLASTYKMLIWMLLRHPLTYFSMRKKSSSLFYIFFMSYILLCLLRLKQHVDNEKKKKNDWKRWNCSLLAPYVLDPWQILIYPCLLFSWLLMKEVSLII